MQNQLPFRDLQPSSLNPRKRARNEQGLTDLAASIETVGVLQNLIVRNTSLGFEIVAGEGRYRGVEKLIAEGRVAPDFQLPVRVIDCNDEQAVELALIENLQREDLHPLDEAEAFAKLVDLKAASGGKKAAASAVKFLAEKLHRTPRYVQKRIKIARDLIPEWQALLEQGVLALNIAQLLCAMPAKAQEEKLNECRHWQRDDVDPDRVRELSARADFANSWRPLAGALFDVKLYDGETEEVDGETFATDTKAFDALQKPASAAFTKEMRGKAKAGDIAFFDELTFFNAANYEQQGDGATPDPAAGVALVKQHDGEFIVYRGLSKTTDLIAREERKKASKAADAKRAQRAEEALKRSKKAEAPKRLPDPRLAQVRAHVEANPAVAMAVEIYHSLSNDRDSIEWFDNMGAPARSVIAVQLLTALNGRGLAKGANLLNWLLAQKLSALAPAWAAMRAEGISTTEGLIEEPSKVEQVLFEHAGAKLPDAAAEKTPIKPDAKRKTASKSKPSKKRKVK